MFIRTKIKVMFVIALLRDEKRKSNIELKTTIFNLLGEVSTVAIVNITIVVFSHRPC